MGQQPLIGRDLQSRPQWRLITDVPRGAAENMAIDEAIMRSCAEGFVPPTIRIYSWQRPSISLGCHQPVSRDRFDLDYCDDEGIEVVRRITGGRAVVHGSDVTFSISIREADLPEDASSILASHQWLMGGIVAGLRRLGLEAEIGDPGDAFRVPHSAFRNSTDCFAHIAECDVRVGARKAAGSAQVRRFGALLEQGTIPYAGPVFDAARVFRQPTRPAADPPLSGSTYAAISEALIKGLSAHLGFQIEQMELTDQELGVADELAETKYAMHEWTIGQLEPLTLSGGGDTMR